jgi:hypothetical protein
MIFNVTGEFGKEILEAYAGVRAPRKTVAAAAEADRPTMNLRRLTPLPTCCRKQGLDWG